MKMHKVLAIVGLLVLLSGGTTGAQVTTGTISGTVKDSTGATLPATKVVVLNEGTGISRTVETNTEGRYSAPSLSPGSYQVTGTLPGFQTEVRNGIVLTVGQEALVDLSLAVGTVTQKVEVTGEAPLVESTTASLGSLVDDHTIRALPLNGRSYDQLALLQPAVIQINPGQSSGAPFTPGTGTRFSVGGQRPYTNTFLLDGTSINDQANATPGGAAGLNLGVDTILEFKIFTSSYKAEFGRSAGSVITAVTRSGTNTLHGTAFEYIRNSALDARNYFDVGSSPPPFRRNQFGGVLGGPIKKNKTFFFTGYEGLRQGLGTTQIATVPTALARQGILPTGTVKVNPVVVPYLNLFPLPNGRDFGDGSAQYLSSPTVITNEDNFMVRVDHQLNEKTGIFGRYTFDTDSVDAPQSLPSSFILGSSRRQYATLQANSILGVKALNSFRFAFNRSNDQYNNFLNPDPVALDFIPGVEGLGAVQLGGITSAGSRALTVLGASQGLGLKLWAYNNFESGDDFSYVTGKHSLKTGVDIERVQDNTALGNALKGIYTFTTFPTFLAGTPSNLSAGAPLGVNAYVGLRQTLYAVYGQDDYTVNSRLTLNLGLRWEITTDPTEVNGKNAFLPSPAATATVIGPFFTITKKNFEPRFGLAWQLNANGKTVLRVGGGIFHDQLLPWAYGQSGSIVPPFFGTLSVTNPPFPNGYQTLKAPPPGSIAAQLTGPHQKTPVDDQYNLSIEQEIFRNTVVQVAYAGSHGNHELTQTEQDSPIPSICSTSLNNCPAGLANGTVYYPPGAPRRNPAWAGIRWYQTNGNSDYNSATVTLRSHLSSGFQGQIFYSFSKAMDESSGVAQGESLRSPPAVLYAGDIARDWGLSDFDSRQALGANFSYPLPFRVGSRDLGAVVNGWTFDGIVTLNAGLPLTARLSKAVSGDLNETLVERPNLNPGFSPNPIHGTSAGCAGFAAGTPVGNANNWYDPCAFSVPATGTYGDLGRNTIIGPGIENVNLALEKSFKLHENANVAFRAEMFNVMNHANFGLPNTNALATNGAASPSAGNITYTITSSRQLQFAVRINF